MSNISPIGIRIASQTRYFETTGDSSYYYSSQLVTNLSFLKAIKKLGQQLGWPTKIIDRGPPKKQNNATFLAKAKQSVLGSRTGHFANLKSTPCKEWVSANHKVIEKLATSRQFFDSKAIGFLAKSLGYVADWRSGCNVAHDSNLVNGASVKTEPINLEKGPAFKSRGEQAYKKNLGSCFASNGDPFTSFAELAQLARYSNSKFFMHSPEAPLGQIRSGTFSKKANRPAGKRNQEQSSLGGLFQRGQGRLRYRRIDSKQAFKTPASLSFYLTTLGLIGHCQVLRSSLAITPIIKGSLQSNLLLANHSGIIKLASSGGLGLVATAPKCYISRSYKETVLNLFFKIPAKATALGTNQTFVLGDLRSPAKEHRKNLRLKTTSASVRWS